MDGPVPRRGRPERAPAALAGPSTTPTMCPQKTDTHGSERPADWTAANAPAPDPGAVQTAIRARTEEIKRQELGRAFDRLEADGTLTEDQRRVLTNMATAIVDDVLRAPAETLTDIDDHDAETGRTAIDLFDPPSRGKG